MIFTGMLERFTGRASLENPNTPLSAPDDWLWEAFGASRSASGTRVSRNTALTYSAVWRGVNLLSRSVGSLPLYTYRREGEGKHREASHPAYSLLRWKPNNEMTAFIFKQTLTAHVILGGNGYAFINRRGSGAPMSLVPLNPDETYPVRENGKLYYINKIGLRWEPIDPENILHIKGLGFDGLCGYSVITLAKNSFGLGLAMQEFSSQFFRNSAKPSIVIEVPGAMPPAAQREFLEQWNQMHQGLENAHKAAIITNAGKVHELTINARDSQLSELKEHELREVANWLNLAPHKVGDTSRTAYASLEQENQSYLDEGLDPWLVNWEEECRDKLLSEAEKANDTHVIEFMRQALVRADLATRGNFYNTALQNGWMNRDEVRGRENLNPLPDGEGEKFFIPMNMTLTGEDDEAADGETTGTITTDDVQATALNGAQVSSLLQIVLEVVAGNLDKDSAKALIAAAFPEVGQSTIDGIIDPLEVKEPEPPPAPFGAQPQPPAAEPEMPDDMGDDEMPPEGDRFQPITEIRRTIVVDAARRMVKRLGVHARKAARKPDEFLAWLDSLEDDHRATVTEALTPGIRLCSATIGRDVPPDAIVDGLFADMRAALLDVSGECKASELAAGVDACMTRYETSAPETLADKVLGAT